MIFSNVSISKRIKKAVITESIADKSTAPADTSFIILMLLFFFVVIISQTFSIAVLNVSDISTRKITIINIAHDVLDRE